MTFLLDTNVISELRKAKTGKINPNVKAWEKRGEEKGEHKKALAIAKQLVNFNLSLEEISQITGITLSELAQINRNKK